jgi:hypothetical protein
MSQEPGIPQQEATPERVVVDAEMDRIVKAAFARAFKTVF